MLLHSLAQWGCSMADIEQVVDYRYANVYGIYGHLGGGKTLTAVEIMVDFLRRGFPVVSNVQLRNIDSLRGSYSYIEDFSSVDFWSLPCGAARGSGSSLRAAVVIDEAAEMLDQFSSTSNFTKSFLSWLRHSSKRGQFVFLIIQRPEFLVKSARLLVNRWILCDDMAQWRMPLLKIPVPFMGGLVRRIAFDRMGNQISKGMCLCEKQKIGRYYDTAQSIATHGRNMQTVEYHEPAKDITLIFFILLILFFLFRLWQLGIIPP